MDFSSLDLLASTALRDNNPSHADNSTTPAEPNHPQHNHHDSVDNDEDDDEADDNRNAVKESVQKTTETNESDPAQTEMGSVKCAKNKKNTAKPMSIFVRDGKCVAKHVSTDKACVKKGSEVTKDSSMTVPCKVNPAEQRSSSPQNIPTPCNKSSNSQTQTVEAGKVVGLKPARADQPSCNGIGDSDHQKSVPAVSSKSTLQQTVTHSDHQTSVPAVTSKSTLQQTVTHIDHQTSVPAVTCKSTLQHAVVEIQVSDSVSKKDACDSDRMCRKASQDPVPESDSCGQVTKRDSVAADASVDVCSDSVLKPSVVAVACDGGKDSTSEPQDGQGENSDWSNSVASTGDNKDQSPSSVHRTDAGTQSSDVLKSSSVTIGKNVNISSDRLTFTLSNGSDVKKSVGVVSSLTKTTETRTPNVCDEELPVASSCSHSEVKADGQNSSCKFSMDQSTGSLGNKEPLPSTSTNSASVNSVLSPPPPPPPRPPPVDASLALLDHTYCGPKGKSLENIDDIGDAFESADENASADEIERRPRSFSVDSMYLHCNSAGLPSQQEVTQNDKLPLISPTPSMDSISNDSSLSEHSTAAGGQCYSILVGSPTPKGINGRPNLAFIDSQGTVGDRAVDGACRVSSNMLEAGGTSSLLDASSLMTVGPKCGKFRIGNLGSFSNSHLELEKECRKSSKWKTGLASDPVMKTPLASPAVASPGSPFPLFQSPGLEWDRSDAGSEAPDDLDSSTTEDKFLSSSHDSEVFSATVSQVWRHPVFHDHDYCSKEVSEEYLGKPPAPTPQLKTGKRKYVKKKDRQESEEEKLKKGKYLKRELLKQDNRFNLGAGRSVENRAATARSALLAESLATKPNPVGRPRKRTEKQLEEYDPETGSKMKITGKYQDQYVYYLNKSSRNRRRKVDEKIPLGDKIILPAPKPGDIVVPHLSDADCEAIRHGGRMALMNTSALPHADSGDMDSSIVNTILSMETEHGNLHSPIPTYDGVGSGEDFAADIEGNLTSEQVKMLFDCLEDYQMEETTTSQEMDLFTSAEAVSVPSTTVDSLAATSVEEDLLVPAVMHPPSDTGSTGPSGSASLLPKMEPCSPVQVKQEQDDLACKIKTEMEHPETKPLVGGIPVPPTSQPSVEKNLEFLKTPFFLGPPVPPSGSHGLFAPAPPTSLMAPLADSKSDEVNETPWIVTVTLYYNDIPAIVINNMPHVRLVDIHRQILPAKDTGILKKRCQLMNIQVSNCTEMQRYFLVQYGRAHNSKSTLVISKDEAQDLITYYAHPPPRNLRGEEGTGLRRSSSYAELRSIMERPSNPGRHSSLALSQPRKRGGFRRRPLPTRSHNPSPEPIPPAATPVVDPLTATQQPAAPAPASSAKGLRHKKINFREMLKGEDSSSHLSPLADSLDEDSLAEEAPVTKGRRSKASASARGRKRRGPNKDAEGSPAKRGRKASRKKDEGKDGSKEVGKNQADKEVVEEKDTASVVMSSKSKKRSPGSTGGGTLSNSGRSPKSKYGPIKVNVKSLVNCGGSLFSDGSHPKKKNLFGRKSSTTDAVVDASEEAEPRSNNPLRVLRISHQHLETTLPPSPQILSPTAEVHLDLYKRATSPCVKCRLCQMFLSVGDFLNHQHVAGEEEVVGSTADIIPGPNHPRRVLVPMNKENISLEEQRLWNEFVALQESLDHSVNVASMGAYPLTPLSPASPIGSSLNRFGEGRSPAVEDSQRMTPESPHPATLPNGFEDSGLDAEVASPPVTVMDDKHFAPGDSELCSAADPSSVEELSLSPEAAACPWDAQIPCSPSSQHLPSEHTQNEEKCLDNSAESDPLTVLSDKRQWSPQRQRTTGIRTSSRKREGKRLYSFENYEYGVGGKKGGRGEAETQDFDDDVPDNLMDNVSGVPVNDAIFLASPASLHEPQNA